MASNQSTHIVQSILQEYSDTNGSITNIDIMTLASMLYPGEDINENDIFAIRNNSFDTDDDDNNDG